MSMSTAVIEATAAGDGIEAAIRREHEAASTAARSALDHALECGRLLAQAREGIAHGGWEVFVRERCGIPARTARLYLRLDANRERIANRQHVAGLTVREAVRELTVPRGDADAERPAVQHFSAAAKAKAESLEAERILGTVSDRYATAGLPGPDGVLVYFDEQWLSVDESQEREFEAHGCRFNVRLPVGVELLSEKSARSYRGHKARQVVPA